MTLKINIVDSVNVKDIMFTNKYWLGKVYGFYTVKVSPVRLER